MFNVSLPPSYLPVSDSGLRAPLLCASFISVCVYVSHWSQLPRFILYLIEVSYRCSSCSKHLNNLQGGTRHSVPYFLEQCIWCSHLISFGLEPLTLWRMAVQRQAYGYLPSRRASLPFWPVPIYTVWWQRHVSVDNLPVQDTGTAGSRTRDLRVASPTP